MGAHLDLDDVVVGHPLAMSGLRALRLENDHMRAALANGPGPCRYCALPRAKWQECSAGFPGCARGDDAVLCPHVGAALGSDRDAARYRWLRDVGDATWRPFGLREGYSAEQADAEIDKAIAKADDVT